ncbi:MAG: glycosyltransferase family 4 protein, partial [Candidatus Binatia bacterium]
MTTPVFPPELGGPASFVPRFASFLIEKGHAVSVLSYTDDPSTVAGYPFPVSLVKRRWLPARLLSFFVRCLRLAARCDIVVVCEHPALLSVLAARLLRRPVALRVMVNPAWELCYRFGLTRDDPERFASARHGPAVRLIEKVQKLSMRRADLVLAVSRHLAETAARLGAAPERIFVSYNLPPPPDGVFAAARPEARRRLAIDAGRFDLLVVARLVDWKGVDTVLSVLRELPDVYRLRVVGDGPDAPRLRKLARTLG